MNFNQAFNEFKNKYIHTPRVVDIIEDQFGGTEITVIYYDKYDKSPPFIISSWEGYPVDTKGVFEVKNMWEKIFDTQVLNSPSSWEEEVPLSQHYKSICKKITEFEMRNK